MNFHQNSLKLLLLLHFSMDSFETRYTYFLGSPQTLFLIFLIFWFVYEFSSNFHWNCYCSYNFQWIPLKLCTCTYYLGQSSHLLFSFLKLAFIFLFFTNFHQIFIEIASAPTVSNGFLCNRYTYSLGQSSHLLFRFLKFEFFLFFGQIFIQVSFKSLLLLQYLMDSCEILTEKMASVADPAYNSAELYRPTGLLFDCCISFSSVTERVGCAELP